MSSAELAKRQLELHWQPRDGSAHSRLLAAQQGDKVVQVNCGEMRPEQTVECALKQQASESRSANQQDNVHDVRRNFIALIKHNKLHHLYLGALLFVALTLIGALLLSPTASKHPAVDLQANQERAPIRLLAGCCGPLALVLVLVAAWSTLQSGANNARLPPIADEQSVAAAAEAGRKLRRKLEARLRSAGLIVTLVLLCAPFVLPRLENLMKASTQPEEQQQSSCLPHKTHNAACASSPPGGAAPLAAILLLIYLQEFYLASTFARFSSWSSQSNSLRRLLAVGSSCALSALFALHMLARQQNQSQEGERKSMQLLATCLGPPLLALACGQLKRRLFERAVARDTFAGAAQLIEAKVSLEHQRQQQETLLLSVLPAYVAEQVKRNMLKKTNTPNSQASAANELVEQQALTHQRAHSKRAGSLQQEQSAAPQTQKARWPSTSRLNLAQEASESSEVQQAHASLNQPSSSPVPTAAAPSAHQLASARRGFNELYIRTYNNVSLLYGDIVGFTRLCTQLSSSQLVRVLNDLFSHFDHLAEKHKIMRIKILGDCYYGVAGIPEFAVMGAKSRASKLDNHATNCVNMGLDMIHYIRRLNIERCSRNARGLAQQVAGSLSHGSMCGARLEPSAEDFGGSNGAKSAGNCTPLPAFELNMRIGIHTGHIHSGVIGLKKWQFDVWSNDVSIAMHCESSGVAGRVQVTETTVQHLRGAFSFEDSQAQQRDPFLAARDIRTYLVCERNTRNVGRAGSLRRPHEEAIDLNWGKKKSRLEEEAPQTSGAPSKHQLDEDNIRQATIGTIRQTLLAGDSCNSRGSSSYGFAFNHHDMRTFTLAYRDSTMNKIYSNCLFANSNECSVYSHNHRIRNHRLLLELIGSILLLLLIYPFVSFKLLLSSHLKSVERPQEWWLLFLLFSIVTIILLIASFALRFNCTSNGKSLSSMAKINKNLEQVDLTYNYDKHQRYSMSTIAKSHYQQVIKDKQREKDNCFAIFTQLGTQVNNLNKQLVVLVSHFTSRVLILNKRAAPMIALLMFSTVILSQCYLIYLVTRSTQLPHQGTDNSCKTRLIARLNDFNSHQKLASEQFQFAVILLLAAIDLSINLVSYKVKCLLIVANIAMQFIFYLTKSLNQPGNLQVVYKDCRMREEDAFDDEEIPTNITDLISGPPYLTTQQLYDWSSAALIFVASLWSLAFARQLEYTNRANFLWRNRLNVDHEELEYISGINKVLLENILPSHVVQYYLTHPNGAHATEPKLPHLQPYMRMSFSTMRSLNNELYHEQHDSVAVMFASIPHFYEFYDESDVSKQGLGCIALLNEIICDFDKLLLKNKFSRIEKIKTIGSTYMAAAGLRPRSLSISRRSAGANQLPNSTEFNQTPQSADNLKRGGSQFAPASRLASCSTHGLEEASTLAHQQTNSLNKLNNTPEHISTAARKSNNDCANNYSPGANGRSAISQQRLNLICMIQFATSLMSALNGINRQSFQVFKLRIGVNSGSVIAGVIGAQRPFYDIWGDCVNIASRMESLGQVGRIQVEERTGRLLMESLCAETYSIVRRGPIDVKGKGGMVTYFVDKKTTSVAQVEEPSFSQETRRLRAVADRRPADDAEQEQARPAAPLSKPAQKRAL